MLFIFCAPEGSHKIAIAIACTRDGYATAQGWRLVDKYVPVHVHVPVSRSWRIHLPVYQIELGV